HPATQSRPSRRATFPCARHIPPRRRRARARQPDSPDRSWNREIERPRISFLIVRHFQPVILDHRIGKKVATKLAQLWFLFGGIPVEFDLKITPDPHFAR